MPGGPPILLANARHDPATGYAWATNVARQLGDRATLLTYDGWGHVVYDTYLISLSVPPRDTAANGRSAVGGEPNLG